MRAVWKVNLGNFARNLVLREAIWEDCVIRYGLDAGLYNCLHRRRGGNNWDSETMNKLVILVQSLIVLLLSEITVKLNSTCFCLRPPETSSRTPDGPQARLYKPLGCSMLISITLNTVWLQQRQECVCAYLLQITFWCWLFWQHTPVLCTASHICAPLKRLPCEHRHKDKTVH